MGRTTTSEQKNISYGKSYQSSLANTQEDILKQRDAFFQDYFIPEFQEVYNSFDPDSKSGSAQMGLTAGEINKSFDSAQKQTSQILAQRNMADSGAGAALTAANNRARSSALANAYATQAAKSSELKASSLSSLGNLMPQTTTAAPVLTEEKTQGSQKSYGQGVLQYL